MVCSKHPQSHLLARLIVCVKRCGLQCTEALARATCQLQHAYMTHRTRQHTSPHVGVRALDLVLSGPGCLSLTSQGRCCCYYHRHCQHCCSLMSSTPRQGSKLLQLRGRSSKLWGRSSKLRRTNPKACPGCRCDRSLLDTTAHQKGWCCQLCTQLCTCCRQQTPPAARCCHILVRSKGMQKQTRLFLKHHRH